MDTTYLSQEVIAANTNGYEAFFDGAMQNDNPHTEGSDEYRAWDAGWLQACGDKKDAQ